MILLSGNTTDNPLVALSTKQNQLEYLSQQALSSGIEKYRKKDYEGAIKDFSRSVGISPNSSFSADASNYLAITHMKEGNNEKAIQTFKDAINRNPGRDDIHIKLGNLFFGLERYGDAEQEYEEAVKIDKNGANLFSLGQSQLKLKSYQSAENSFQEIIRLHPESGNGYYGLGLVSKDQELYDEAITHFKKAVELKKDFLDGYAELGYSYADSGQIEKAEELVKFLEDERSSLAGTLSSYIYKTQAPEFSFISLESTFPRYSPPSTAVSALDSYLENANTSKQFTMVFQFSKEMDMVSVQNRTNWQISRSEKSEAGAFYNIGQPTPDTEVEISPIPNSVLYNKESMQATVTFTIDQNSTVDATIDPSRILFKFSGEDLFGNDMNIDSDEYSAFTGIA